MACPTNKSSTSLTAVSLNAVKAFNHALTSRIDYPAYELYTDVLRNGIFDDEEDKQMRLVVDKNRKVKEVYRI